MSQPSQSIQPTDRTTKQTTSCPECNGTISTESTERVCTDCGLVIDDQEIDRGPEWRAFSASERDTKSRVGAPTTQTIHDKGLATTISWKNQDGYGNSLSQKQRKKFNRLRTWDKRCETDNKKDRTLKFALGEINRMASALGLPESTRETASVIFRQAHDNNILLGRCVESVATASLYAAARQEQLPRSLDEVTTVSRIDMNSIQRAYSHVQKDLGLSVPTQHAIQYLPRYSAELALDDEVEQRARSIIEMYYETGAASGKKATGLAAAAIYAASMTYDGQQTQPAISEVANITNVTIRNHYKDMISVYNNHNDDTLTLID